MLKRVLLCLALALALCLGLCACDSELPPEKLEPLYGTWLVETAFDGGHKATEGAAFLLTFTEDGQFFFDDQGGMTWTAREDRETSNLEVTIRAEKKVVYKFTMALGDEGTRYNGWLTDKREENFFGTYTRLSTELNIDWADKLFTPWYPNGENGNTMPLVLKADGTCTIGDKAYRWIRHPYWEIQENSAVLFVFDDTMGLYQIHAEMRNNGLPSLYIENIDTYEWVDRYSPHPLMHTFTSWDYWCAFDSNNSVSGSLYVGDAEISVNNTNSPWEISDSTTDEQFVINIPSTAAAEYVLTMTMEGEYPNAALEVKATGEIINYYLNYAGYNPANPEAIYYKAVGAINAYLNNDSIWDEEDNWLHDETILPYAYALFQEVADHKESQSYLDRFTIHPNKLSGITRKTADNLGNQREDTNYFRYRYNEDGRDLYLNDDKHVYTYGIWDLYNYYGYPTYDANGVITEINVKSGDSIYAKCTPTYDEAGKLISMHVQKNSEEYTSTFTYNDQGQLELLEIPYYEDSPYRFAYTYDEDGQLIQLIRDRNSGSWVNTYIYDFVYEKGALVQQSVAYYEGYRGRENESYSTTYTYTNDAEGNPLSAVITSTNPNYSYVKEEYIYVYQDIYFYSAE